MPVCRILETWASKLWRAGRQRTASPRCGGEEIDGRKMLVSRLPTDRQPTEKLRCAPMPAAVKVKRRTWRIAAEPGAPKKATVARFNIVASAVWKEEMAPRVSKKTAFEIRIKKQENGNLTPAVRGDYAKHNCPLDQYVRQTADATIVELRMNFTGVALDV